MVSVYTKRKKQMIGKYGRISYPVYDKFDPKTGRVCYPSQEALNPLLEAVLIFLDPGTGLCLQDFC